MRVLYVGRDRAKPDNFCPGSMVCMSLVEKIEVSIQVQDCSVLRRHQRMPDWLNGTPIYVDQDEDAVPLRGTEAVRALQMLLSNQAPQEEEDAAPTRQAVSSAVPRMQPMTTREPSTRPPRAEMIPHRNNGDSDVVRPDEMADDELPPDTMANGESNDNNAPISDGKVTDNDLQRFMEARKQSPAQPSPTMTPQQ